MEGLPTFRSIFLKNQYVIQASRGMLPMIFSYKATITIIHYETIAIQYSYYIRYINSALWIESKSWAIVKKLVFQTTNDK